MKNPPVLLALVLACLTGCNKSNAPAASANAAPSKGDAVQQRLQEFAGAPASNCGRLDVHATEVQLKAASDCAQLGKDK